MRFLGSVTEGFEASGVIDILLGSCVSVECGREVEDGGESRSSDSDVIQFLETTCDLRRKKNLEKSAFAATTLHRKLRSCDGFLLNGSSRRSRRTVCASRAEVAKERLAQISSKRSAYHEARYGHLCHFSKVQDDRELVCEAVDRVEY
jgi:hypothetical protein